ncbi:MULTISPECIES: sugar-binding transcriptional regulator [Microbacteriaceae]|uniref:sugar-binding transcriptional regulator n=1 Tax=Microbacteriaceae TaxID=85023 RepID=UPI000370C025|nr:MULTISPECIES: sugar-binding domain-containing protein [Microbacteriaceae]TDQ02796.1 DNA-binding transcriptional regulator LsrR (DeoR family) [Leifsonia sp. 115AMFTsu3.1]
MPQPDTEHLPDKVRDALKAGHLYYMQDLTMEAIAHEMHTSRSSVSRLLSYARSSGLVTIQIAEPHEGASRIQQTIHDRFGIAAHIVPMPSAISDVDRLERVAISAARILDRFIDSNQTVGVAWGSTMSALSRHLIPKELHNVEFVQLNGAGNTYTTGVLYASEILRRFGDTYSGTIQEFPVPALFDDPQTKTAMWRERSTRRILDIQERMDVALFGLGSPFSEVRSHVYAGGYLDQADYASLDESGVVGDVATVFFREDGSHHGIPLNERASGPDIDLIKRVPRRVCIVSGPSKVHSLRGALAAGLITDLIVDEGTARALVQLTQPAQVEPAGEPTAVAAA